MVNSLLLKNLDIFKDYHKSFVSFNQFKKFRKFRFYSFRLDSFDQKNVLL